MKRVPSCLSAMIETLGFVIDSDRENNETAESIFSSSDDYETENIFTKEGNIEETENHQQILELQAGEIYKDVRKVPLTLGFNSDKSSEIFYNSICACDS